MHKDVQVGLGIKVSVVGNVTLPALAVTVAA